MNRMKNSISIIFYLGISQSMLQMRDIKLWETVWQHTTGKHRGKTIYPTLLNIKSLIQKDDDLWGGGQPTAESPTNNCILSTRKKAFHLFLALITESCACKYPHSKPSQHLSLEERVAVLPMHCRICLLPGLQNCIPVLVWTGPSALSWPLWSAHSDTFLRVWSCVCLPAGWGCHFFPSSVHHGFWGKYRFYSAWWACSPFSWKQCRLH